MRFGLDEAVEEEGRRSSLTPTKAVEWLPLDKHPVFTAAATASAAEVVASGRTARNLLAWDGDSRLYLWDNRLQCLHRISIRLGEPEPSFVLAASPSKVLKADVGLEFEVDRISINRNGSALLLAGSDGLRVMYLHGHSSSDNQAIICRAVSVGSEIYYGKTNAIQILQASWHPFSETHIGILSSDSVFRLFDLSLDIGQPEQEYYLQQAALGKPRNAASICPVDFAFGGDHLWDRFSVFILYTDGSIYTICPIVPFRSVHKVESLLEIYADAQTLGLKSDNSIAVNNSNMAVSWLEATFSELAQQLSEGVTLPALRARPYALFDACLTLQGPLNKICHGEEDSSSIRGAQCEGRACNLIYHLVSKDSILVTAWSGGQLQVDALADEIQPVWRTDSAPRLCVDSYDHILGVAMICESDSSEAAMLKPDQQLDHIVWLGHSPPLLRIAIVDLALPKNTEGGHNILMFADSLIPERMYTLHIGGVDSILLPYLPFTNQAGGKDETMRSPIVNAVLTTCLGESPLQSSVCGFTPLADSFGYSWVVGVTSAQECVVLDMKSCNSLLPIQFDMDKDDLFSDQEMVPNPPAIISKELLAGPKAILLPQAPNLRSITADSIEGRSALHQYCRIFHETYVEYGHMVYFELKHHGPQIKKIIDDMHNRLDEAKNKLAMVEDKQLMLDDRIASAIKKHDDLELRLQRLRNLPGYHKKPLSRAERDFKAELSKLPILIL
uniref:Nuclear pore complex protein NUP88 n=1 Tax=Kalanchoe fedtschenkoi TaxID=63787 RepID=A0A7N0TUA6_KALFE